MSIRLKNKEELREQIFTMEQLQNLKFSVEEYFGNQNPVILDAGCGKGEFLLDHAKINPQLNYWKITQTKSIGILFGKILIYFIINFVD